MNLDGLLRDKRIIVLCGAGGVGKTTTAAALGVAAARAGRKVLVLTIDPARRLAEAMGLKENGAEPTTVPPERLYADGPRGEGRLDVWMLEPRIVFERMVRRLSATESAARAILEHRLYRFLSELVAGVQEYAAAEALDTFLAEGHYDLILLDTPPSRHALDFLEAPGRLSRFLDDRVISLFGPDSGRPGRLWQGAQALVGKVLDGIFGGGFTQEMRSFVGAFGGLFAGIRLHADRLREHLSSKDAAFLLVTSPEAAALREAAFFQEALQAKGLPFAGYVLNRSWAREDGLAPAADLKPHASNAADTDAVIGLERLAGVEDARAKAHRSLLARLAEGLPRGALAIAAPDAGADLEDFRGLVHLGDALTVA
ncbi:ArsA family ATPase [Corallococcus aberystwythensis]|uniref:arsenite-transporting ATPase n=1 Tax=Corallococcus aberystwythensis TaxID=2316722 RepID=A0A3A8PKR5_9BACT|nr:ArsA-related P-loop ATPase [Corallococcus aberystwythensis]RKH56689.1 ArsA family ATPase [Corallococcus aberystwythensis]